MERAVLERLIEQNYSFREMAKALDTTLSGIRYWAKRYGLSSPRRRWNVKSHSCSVCGESESEKFYKGRKEKCKACFIAADLEISRRKKAKAVAYMGGKCVSCGYNRYLGALHFHHLDSNKKDDWTNLRNWGWHRIEAELSKCVLVCATCHSEIHGGIISDSQMVAGPPK